MSERPERPRATASSRQGGRRRSAAAGEPVAAPERDRAAAEATEQPVESPRPPATASGLKAKLYRVPILGGIVYLISPPRSGPPSVARRAVSGTTLVAALLGVLMLVYPVAGHLYPPFLRGLVERGIEWSNVFSDLESNRIQGALQESWASGDLAQRYAAGMLAEGDPMTRLRIPKLGVDTLVVSGISDHALRAGAGHYPMTPLPGQAGNVSIAGHRTTYGRPFNRVDELRPGDRIVLETPVGVFTYEVTRDPWITHPRDWSVVEPSGDALLTLTTCHPRGSDRQRMIVRAKMVGSGPPGTAAA